jgi:hypothetical protein
MMGPFVAEEEPAAPAPAACPDCGTEMVGEVCPKCNPTPPPPPPKKGGAKRADEATKGKFAGRSESPASPDLTVQGAVKEPTNLDEAFKGFLAQERKRYKFEG